MALPKSKYSEPKHTPGKEFTLNGKEYVGWYITTFRGDNYSGKALENNSQLLTPLQNSNNLSGPLFIEQEVTPTTNEIKSGIWKRYFIQKVRNRKIIEVNKLRYIEFEKISGYRRVSVDWITKGPAKNLVINGYTYIGANQQNKENIAKLEKTIPGISSYIKNYSEFVE